jgi:hypothetical protein
MERKKLFIALLINIFKNVTYVSVNIRNRAFRLNNVIYYSVNTTHRDLRMYKNFTF